MKRKDHVIWIFLALLTVALASGSALAALGGSADSVESDRTALSAVRRSVTPGPTYTVHEIAYDGTTVREYVSPEGIVFAIAWNGNRSPDLTTLLGSYANEYQSALQNTPHRPGVRHSSIKADNVVVERWGQINNLQGRAYAPSLIPTGVTIDEIK
jgi:hypothetical protein